MFDPETGWFEIAEIRDESSEGTAKILDNRHGSVGIHTQSGVSMITEMNSYGKNSRNC
jgi:hypothetical protein